MKSLLDSVTGVVLEPFETNAGFNEWKNIDLVAQMIVGLNVDGGIALKITNYISSAEMKDARYFMEKLVKE